MSKTTFYIEYLIVGTFALLAIGLATDLTNPKYLASGITLKLIALVPLAYIAGLVIEGAGAIPEEILRTRTDDGPRWRALKEFLIGEDNSDTDEASSSTVVIFAWKSEVGEELKLRRSRDRVARGSMMTIGMLYLYLEFTDGSLSFADWSAKITDCRQWILLLFAILLIIWIVTHLRTRNFKKAAFNSATNEP